MAYNIHRSSERGTSDLGWLQSRFSFSFANYYNPNRMGFGKLRVLNDDSVAAGKGFDTHEHKNMEIITIPTEGSLTHKDSTGTDDTVKPGEVQFMSAGSGVLHSEHNRGKTTGKFFQIWIEPKTLNIKPKYDKKPYILDKNTLHTIIDNRDINQDAKIVLAKFEKNHTITFPLSQSVFLLVIEGKLEVDKNLLSKRDSIEITKTKSIAIKTKEDSFFMIIEVPVH